MTADRRGRAGPSMQDSLARGTAVLVKTGLGVNFILPTMQPSLQSFGVRATLDPNGVDVFGAGVIVDQADPLP